MNVHRSIFDACFLTVIAILSVYAIILLWKQRLHILTAIFIVVMLPTTILKPDIFLPQTDLSLRYCSENPEAVVIVEEVAGLIRLSNNGKPQGSIPSPVASDFAPIASDKPTQVLLGVLPPLFCPSNQSSGLTIGMGTGTTCGAAISLNSVKNCTVIDINPAVFDAAYNFASSNKAPWDSPKFKKKIGDARTFLASTNDKFDWITSQPGEPSSAGSADLFTLEFYQLAKQRLNSNGIFAQWIQLYGLKEKDLICLLDTFKSVFPNTYIFQARGAGEIILISAPPSLSMYDLTESWKKLFRNEPMHQLFSVGIYDPYDLLADCISAPTKRTKQNSLNTDDNLLVEMSSAKTEPPSENQIDLLEKKLKSICQLYESSDPLLEEARHARSIPLYTCAYDYYLLSTLESETVPPVKRTVVPKIDFFGELSCPANLTGVAFAQYKRNEDPEKCYEQFVKSLDINPIQYIANFYAAKSLQKMGRTQDAIYHMNLAAQIFPVSNRPRIWICAALLKTNQLDLARKNIDRLSKRKLNTSWEKTALDALKSKINETSMPNSEKIIEQILAP